MIQVGIKYSKYRIIVCSFKSIDITRIRGAFNIKSIFFLSLQYLCCDTTVLCIPTLTSNFFWCLTSKINKPMLVSFLFPYFTSDNQTVFQDSTAKISLSRFFPVNNVTVYCHHHTSCRKQHKIHPFYHRRLYRHLSTDTRRPKELLNLKVDDEQIPT